MKQKLNPIQNWILLAGILLFILINFFPPWRAFTDPPEYLNSIFIGYGFLLSPPHSDFGYESYVIIDYARLFIQWGILIVCTIVSIILSRK